MALKLHSREQFLCWHRHAAADYTAWRSTTFQKIFRYMYKFCIHIKGVYSLSVFTLQMIKTDIHNIHNDRYIICMHDVEGGGGGG